MEADVKTDGVKTDTDAPEVKTEAQDAPAVNSLLGDQPESGAPEGDGGDKGVDNPETGKEPGKEDPAGAPEKYADFKLPEGVPVDTEFMEQAQASFKELNLPQEAAQKLVDLAAERDKRAEKAQFDQAAKWEKEFMSRSDAKETLSHAARAREFVTPGMRQMLQDPRIGNNPDIIESMAKIGRMLAEDKFLERDSRGKAEKPLGNVLFDDMFAEKK